jgi:hypothetical protein
MVAIAVAPNSRRVKCFFIVSPSAQFSRIYWRMIARRMPRIVGIAKGPASAKLPRFAALIARSV